MTEFYKKEEVVYRYLLSCIEGAWLIEYENPKEPFMISSEEFRAFERVPAPEDFTSADTPKQGYEKTKQKRYEAIQELVLNDSFIIDRASRNKAIKTAAGRLSVSEKTLRRWYFCYLARGEKGLYR